MPANMKKAGMHYQHGGAPVFNDKGTRVPGMVQMQKGAETAMQSGINAIPAQNAK